MREWIDALEDRTRAFAVSVTKSASHVESSFTLREHARQLVRAAGSVAANHRAMRRARSTKEFASKLQIVAEETDECVLWLELLRDAGAPQPAEIQRLFAQAKNRFKDAAVKGVSVEGRFIAAYDAAHSAALAAMRWHGIQQHAFALALRQALGER